MTLNNDEPDILVASAPDAPERVDTDTNDTATLKTDEPDIPVASDVPHIPEPDIYTERVDIETNNTITEVREFPDVFYDPITKKLMQDPVVTSDGNSYERSAVLEQRGDDINSWGKPYPNRALLAIISETIELSGDSFMPMMKQLQKRAETNVRQIFDKSALSDREFRPLSDAYYCSITFGLIHFPVIDPEGNTFEQTAIETWIQKNGASPITRTPLSKEDLYKNHAISALLDEEKRKNTSDIHPSVRRFMQEDPPEAAPGSSDHGVAQSQIYLFPTTPEEMETRRHSTRRARITNIVALLFVVIFLIFSISTGIWFLFIPFVALFYTLRGICHCYNRSTNGTSAIQL